MAPATSRRFSCEKIPSVFPRAETSSLRDVGNTSILSMAPWTADGSSCAVTAIYRLPSQITPMIATPTTAIGTSELPPPIGVAAVVPPVVFTPRGRNGFAQAGRNPSSPLDAGAVGDPVRIVVDWFAGRLNNGATAAAAAPAAPITASRRSIVPCPVDAPPTGA